MKPLHDADCPCSRFQADPAFCNCEAGKWGNAALDELEESSPLLLQLAAGKTGWRRKRGTDRKIGYRRLEQWTPKKAHKFASTRLTEIAGLLQEIEMLYDDVDQIIVAECEEVRARVLPSLQELVDSALTDDTSL